MSKQIGADRAQLYCDSWLVVSQVVGEFEAKDQRMINYLKKFRVMKWQFKQLEISYISRGSNSHADSLATQASTVANPLPRIVSVELLPFSSLTHPSNVVVLSIRPSPS